MSKIQDEARLSLAEECKGKEHLIPFEEYLTDICITDEVAEKILNKAKSLSGAFDHMKNIARRRQINGMAYIPTEEGFRIIDEYYGITEDDKLSKAETPIIDILDLL